MVARKLAAAVDMRCPKCGKSWQIERRADGTYPKTARCAQWRGGCGHTVKVPRRPAALSRITSVNRDDDAPDGEWDPPGEPRQPQLAGEPCPHCGAPVKIEPRGITWWCPACPVLLTPPGVLVPYERGAGTERAAKSQRERDDDAKKTVLMAGEFLRRVRAMLDDPQVHPASGDLLAWYEEEITEARKARDGRRLAELADEFSADHEARAFRRRHWWQGQPAAITAADGEDTEDYDDDDEDQAAEPAPAPVIPVRGTAQLQRMTWAEALTACGWRLSPTADGCQVIDEHGQRCTAGIAGSPPIVDALGRHGWLCSWHYGTLGRVIIETNRSRGVA